MGLPIVDLEELRIASPCTMRWEDMTGGDRVRHCAACQKNVFNLSGMKRAEAIELLRGTEGKVCARFYKRADGTVLTTDCPVGVRLVARRAKRMALGAVATSLGAAAAVLAFLAGSPMRRVVDVTKIRDATVHTIARVEEKHSALIVPEPPHEQYAGGITPMPMEPPVVAHKAPAKKVRTKPTPPPPPEPFMGDVDIAQ